MRGIFDFVAGCVFAVVSLAHLVRIVLNWEVIVGQTVIPYSISWLGMFAAGALAAWGFTAATRHRQEAG